MSRDLLLTQTRHTNRSFSITVVMLVLQNASVSLLTRLSRTPAAGQAIYAPSVAVFTAEVLKFAVSLAMLARERERSHRRSRRKGSKGEGLVASAVGALRELFAEQRGEVVKLAVPAGLYALQNTLLVSTRAEWAGAAGSKFGSSYIWLCSTWL